MIVRALRSNSVLCGGFVVMTAFIATALLPGVAGAQTNIATPPATIKPAGQAAKPETQKPDPSAPAKTKLTLESLAGTWDGVAQTPNGDLPVHTVLTFQDGKLTGSIESQMGVSPITGAKLTDDVLDLSFELQGAVGTLSGKIAGDKYEGTWAVGADSGPFAMARVPPDQIKK